MTPIGIVFTAIIVCLVISTFYSSWCEEKANSWLVDNTDVINEVEICITSTGPIIKLIDGYDISSYQNELNLLSLTTDAGQVLWRVPSTIKQLPSGVQKVIFSRLAGGGTIVLHAHYRGLKNNIAVI